MRALLVLLALAGVAHAEPKRKAVPDKFTKAASDAFTAAATADGNGDLRGALGLYQKAQAISPHPSTVYNIADVQRRLSNLSEAIKSFELYLAMSPDAKDRGEVEAAIEQLSKTPGTIHVVTTETSDPRSLDLPAGYVLVDGEIKKKPGPVPSPKPRNIPIIDVQVPPGKHVVDFVTPLTYATADCDVEPGGQDWCEMKAEPRLDGNAVVSASDRRMDVIAGLNGKDLLYKRFELKPGKQRLVVKDRGYGCTTLAIDVTPGNAVAYAFLRTTDWDGFKHCRTIDIKQVRLQFEP